MTNCTCITVQKASHSPQKPGRVTCSQWYDAAAQWRSERYLIYRLRDSKCRYTPSFDPWITFWLISALMPQSPGAPRTYAWHICLCCRAREAELARLSYEMTMHEWRHLTYGRPHYTACHLSRWSGWEMLGDIWVKQWRSLHSLKIVTLRSSTSQNPSRRSSSHNQRLRAFYAFTNDLPNQIVGILSWSANQVCSFFVAEMSQIDMIDRCEPLLRNTIKYQGLIRRLGKAMPNVEEVKTYANI